MEDEFVCRACGAPFSTKEDLDIHNAETHPEGVPPETPPAGDTAPEPGTGDESADEDEEMPKL